MKRAVDDWSTVDDNILQKICKTIFKRKTEEDMDFARIAQRWNFI